MPVTYTVFRSVWDKTDRQTEIETERERLYIEIKTEELEVEQGKRSITVKMH